MTKITELTEVTVLANSDQIPVVDVSATPPASGTTKRIAPENLLSSIGVKWLTGGGSITASMITSAISEGYQQFFLDPRYVWDASGLIITNITDFVIESAMRGSIGWSGSITYHTGGYITTGSAAGDGIKVYGTGTKGIIFRNCVIVGSNSNAVLHFGGGQRRCGTDHSLVYNTNSAANAYGFIIDTALSDNNSENNTFISSDFAGEWAGLGIGTGNQTQKCNDCNWIDITTHGGVHGMVAESGGGHLFLNYYDRSSPAGAVVWNKGARLTFHGGEDYNLNATGYPAHQVDAAAFTTFVSRTMTGSAASTPAIEIYGQVTVRGEGNCNGFWHLNSGGFLDLNDTAIHGGINVTGTAGTLLLANTYLSGSRDLTGYSGTIKYLSSSAVASTRATNQTTTQTLSWTPPAASVRFRVSLWLQITVAGTSTIPSLAFTQYGGTAIDHALPMWRVDGSAAAPVYDCPAADTYVTTFMGDTNSAAAPIVLTITPNGSTYRWSASIERIA